MRWHKMDDNAASAAPAPGSLAGTTPAAAAGAGAAGTAGAAPKKQRWPHRHKAQQAVSAGASGLPHSPAQGVVGAGPVGYPGGSPELAGRPMPAPAPGGGFPPGVSAPRPVAIPVAGVAPGAPQPAPARSPMAAVSAAAFLQAAAAQQSGAPAAAVPVAPVQVPPMPVAPMPVAPVSLPVPVAPIPAPSPTAPAAVTERAFSESDSTTEHPAAADQPFAGTEEDDSRLDLAAFAAQAKAGDPRVPAPELTPAIELIAQIDVSKGFGERIDRLIALAVTEADALREEAVAEASRERHDAKLDAERFMAAAQRQAAEIIAAAHRRAEGDIQAATDNRRESEQTLHQAHQEAEIIRRRSRDEAAELRKEIDNHAQSLLARTHEDTTRTLVAARAEIEQLQTRKTELESQLAALRAMLQDAMAPKLPGLHDILTVPEPPFNEPTI